MVQASAIRIHKNGGPDVLKLETIQISDPGPGEILVEQKAIGLNFIDTYIRSGLYPAKLPATPGFEGAGRVIKLGEGVTEFSVGDRVAYSSFSGTYATHVKGPVAKAVKVPEGVSEEEAACLMLKGMTAWMLLFEIAKVQPGDKLLIWAAAGGVGTLATRWAKALGAVVIGVVSTDEKAELVKANGGDHVILSSEDVPARVKELTGGKGVDVSIDGVGKDSAASSIDSLRPRGLYITYGNASGAVEPIAPLVLQQKGSLMMTRPTLFHYTAERADLDRAAAAVFGALKVGAIKAEIGQRYALKDVAQAHIDLEGRKTTGATIIVP
ncbi:MAG: quinone oxidoreductase [Ponticaulis sp.]|nr:quinone oxidoreductase [Ponticaulis sp.]